MRHASTIDVGARKRRQDGINEDSIATAVFQNHHRDDARPVGVFVLADGVGGEAAGDVASFLATTVVREHLADALLGGGTDVPDRFDVDDVTDGPPTVDGEAGDVLDGDRIREHIQEGVDRAHQRIQEFAREVGHQPATTIVVCVYVDGELHYGWVGDSRAYVINTDREEIQQLTTDHAATNHMLEEGDLDDEVHARVHEDATAITNALGGSGYGEPSADVEFGSVDVYRDDVIVVTSDGLIDAYPNVGPLRETFRAAEDKEAAREEILDVLVTDDEIRDAVLAAEDLHEAVDDLVELANDRGGKDNLSITLARDPTAPPTPSVLPDRGLAAEPEEELAARDTVIKPGGEDGDDDTGTEEASEDEGRADDESGDVDDADSSTAGQSTADGPGVEGPGSDGSGRADDDGSDADEAGGDDLGTDAGRDASSNFGSDDDTGSSFGSDDDTGSSFGSDDIGSSFGSDDDTGSAAGDAAGGSVGEAAGSAPADADTGAEPDKSGRAEGRLGADHDDPTAAVSIVGDDAIYEIADGFTVGCKEADAEDNPNLGLVLDDSDIARHHARFERDEAGYWRVRDLSGSGTYVRAGEDQWLVLRNEEAVDDPEDGPNESYRLEDGMAISLEHPGEGATVVSRFFTSVDRAKNHDGEDTFLDRLLSR